MKKIFQLVALAVTSLAFVGCVTANHSEFDTARAQSDSIQLRAKDSLLNEAFSSIEQISNALSQITQRERIVASTSAGEINKSAKDRIAENIAAISELLQQNRASINRLSASAKKTSRSQRQSRSFGKLGGFVRKTNFGERCPNRPNGPAVGRASG